MRHVNETEQLAELGGTYIDDNRKECVWRRGPAPDIPIHILQYDLPVHLCIYFLMKNKV